MSNYRSRRQQMNILPITHTRSLHTTLLSSVTLQPQALRSQPPSFTFIQDPIIKNIHCNSVVSNQLINIYSKRACWPLCTLTLITQSVQVRFSGLDLLGSSGSSRSRAGNTVGTANYVGNGCWRLVCNHHHQ